MRKAGTQLIRRAPQVPSAVLALLVWQVCAVIFHPKWLPTVPAVATQWWVLASAGAFDVLLVTLRTLSVGLAIVFVIGAVVAGLFRVLPVVNEAVSPLVNVAMSTPTVALVPVFVFIWGYGSTTRIVTVVSFALFPLILQWASALTAVPEHLLEMSRSLEASRWGRLRTVVIPAAAPMLLTGVRVAVVQAIKGVVTAEIVIGVVGVGKLLSVASQTFDMPLLYAIIVTLLVASIVSYALLSVLEHRASRWADS